jgi:Type IV secretion system pilin
MSYVIEYMKLKQTVISLFIGITLLLGVAALYTPGAYAVTCNPDTEKCCGGVPTSLITCPETGGEDESTNGVWAILKLVMQIMTGGVGVLAVGGLVYAGIVYTAAHGQPEQIKKARGMITNVVVGIIMYAIMFSLLNFLVPGGVL